MRRGIDILLVEDNPGDIDLVREGFGEEWFASRVHVVSDGVEAMRFVRREGRYADMPRPDLVILDLNLPRKDGRQVLEELKADTGLRAIPVVILTSSRAEDDVAGAYDRHANCYVTKPMDFDRYLDVVGSIKRFWSTVAELPSRRPASSSL